MGNAQLLCLRVIDSRVAVLPVWREANPNFELKIGQNVIMIFIYWILLPPRNVKIFI